MSEEEVLLVSTNEGGYGFCFFHGDRGTVDQERWAEAALALFDELECPPTLVGRKSKWVKAPAHRGALFEILARDSIGSLQGGTNPHSSAPFDGGGLDLSSLSESAELNFSLYVPGNLDLGLWMRLCEQVACACMRVRYGYAYRGDFPKDASFGMGMFRGKPSYGLKALFSPDAVTNWSRAKSWQTHLSYLRDVFMENVLDDAMLRWDVGGAELEQVAQQFGTLLPLESGLWQWSLHDNASREAAAGVLSRAGLLVAFHAPDTASQLRPAPEARGADRPTR